jgi:hypothetical protein
VIASRAVNASWNVFVFLADRHQSINDKASYLLVILRITVLSIHAGEGSWGQMELESKAREERNGGKVGWRHVQHGIKSAYYSEGRTP